MQKIAYQVVRSNRKSVALVIDNEANLIVRAPALMPDVVIAGHRHIFAAAGCGVSAQNAAEAAVQQSKCGSCNAKSEPGIRNATARVVVLFNFNHFMFLL